MEIFFKYDVELRGNMSGPGVINEGNGDGVACRSADVDSRPSPWFPAAN